jgi:hypothetical protein
VVAEVGKQQQQPQRLRPPRPQRVQEGKNEMRPLVQAGAGVVRKKGAARAHLRRLDVEEQEENDMTRKSQKTMRQSLERLLQAPSSHML